MRRLLQPFSAPVVLLGGLLGALGGSSSAFPQAEVDTNIQDLSIGPGFFEVMDVEIVNIDVSVTDKQGLPVEGLGKDDFQVYRDGQPIEVTNFYAVSDGRPVPSADPDVAPPAPAPGADRSPPEPGGGLPSGVPEVAPEHRLWLIVYVDNANVDPIERNRVLPALQTFLGGTLRKGDQAMLVRSTRSAEVLQPFTNDIPQLLDALDQIRDDSGLAVVRTRSQMATLKRIDDADDSSSALLAARQYAEEQMNDVQYTVKALEQLIDSLGGLPGRKALIHVSSGVPMLAGEEMFHAVAEKFQTSEAYAEIPRHDTSRSFERVNRLANAHRVSFYTVDAGGLQGIEFGAAEYAGFVHPRLRTTLDSIVPENLQSPLRFMALETGGRAIVNRNDVLPALEEAARDFRSFYSLGISAGGGDTGRYHEIKVKLRERRKGVSLRHRAGYRSKDSDTRVRESLRSALLYSHQTNPLNVKVTWGQAQPYGKDGNYLLPIRLHIPLAGTVLLPIGGKHEARLKLFVGAIDGDGGTSPIDATPLGLRLDEEHVEAAKNESLVHTHKLLLSPGRKKVGVVILDLFGLESSIVTRFVQVGPAADSG